MRLILGLVTAALLFAGLPSAAAAQRGRTQVNEGNRLYEEGLFEEAHERYLEALREAPNSPLVLFNDGNALYQTEEYERALDADPTRDVMALANVRAVFLEGEKVK